MWQPARHSLRRSFESICSTFLPKRCFTSGSDHTKINGHQTLARMLLACTTAVSLFLKFYCSDIRVMIFHENSSGLHSKTHEPPKQKPQSWCIFCSVAFTSHPRVPSQTGACNKWTTCASNVKRQPQLGPNRRSLAAANPPKTEPWNSLVP